MSNSLPKLYKELPESKPIARRIEQKREEGLLTVDDIDLLERHRARMASKSKYPILITIFLLTFLLPCVPVSIGLFMQHPTWKVFLVCAVPALVATAGIVASNRSIKRLKVEFDSTDEVLKELVHERDKTQGGISLIDHEATGGELTISEDARHPGGGLTED